MTILVKDKDLRLAVMLVNSLFIHRIIFFSLYIDKKQKTSMEAYKTKQAFCR